MRQSEDQKRAAPSEESEPSDVILRVEKITRDIAELEEWAIMVASQLMALWKSDFPPMTLSSADRDESPIERPYTTAAIYLVRLGEARAFLETVQQIPKGLTKRLGPLPYGAPKDCIDAIDSLVKERTKTIVDGAKKDPPEEELQALLHESSRIHEAYAAGYIAQASLHSAATRLPLWSRLAGLLGITERGPTQQSKSLFYRRATHANAFLFYLTVAGVSKMRKVGIDSAQESTWSGKVSEVIQKVQERTHYLLAKGLMSDSAEFDPGELAHAVATLRLLENDKDEWWRRGARRDLFQQCYDFIFGAQSSDGLWNAGRPWIYTAEGGALHMISLERANAALEVLSDFPCVESGLFERYLPNFRRTHHWLRRTLQHIPDSAATEIWGWTSEHSFEYASKIHLWVNAHALHFCILYRQGLRSLLEKLVLAEFPLVRRPSEFDPKPLVDPLTGTKQEVWAQIDSRLPRLGALEDPNWNYSYMLYGPPGTSKTSLARKAAEKLQVPFITITCSDFISQGGDSVEAQASRIFKLLMALPRGVVLFDEIDPFIHDREDRGSSEKFQFMTTSMLPKLQDLRDQKRVVFFIATNNAERIDLAIQRSGRVDLKLLVPPPNAAARRAIVKQVLPKAFDPARGKQIADEIAKNGHWYTFSELKNIVLRMADGGATLKKSKEAISPAASIAVYAARCKSVKKHSRDKDVAAELLEVMHALDLGPEALSGEEKKILAGYFPKAKC